LIVETDLNIDRYNANAGAGGGEAAAQCGPGN
jgi:hypothetical protein